MIHIIKKHNQKETTIIIITILLSLAFLPITNATIETQNAETNTPKTITKMDETIHIEFTRPISNSFYFRNQRLFPIQNNIISYGPIELEAYATAENNITYVEFYDDNTLIYTDYTAPYTYIWNPIRCLQHTIKVTAYDTQKNAISDELTITKWRSHPLLIVTATALALYIGAYVFNGDPLLGWTAIRGYVVNIKKEGNDLVFRAIRLHYTEVTPREVSTGVLKFQKIRISDIGPDRRVYLGPFGTYVYITGICHGGIQEI
jgi:hypothetical protein